jgi:hypothetical protein
MKDNPSYENFRTKCLICKDEHTYKYLGSHISRKHRILVKEYKKTFGLPYNLSLMDDETMAKKKKAFNDRREYYLKNLNLDNNNFRFKKGNSRKGKYFSKLEMQDITKRILKDNNSWECPVCKMQFDHVWSHLANAHNLIRLEEKNDN